MASMALQIDGLKSALEGMAQPLDFAPALKGIKQILIGATKENFQGQHDPDGVPWKPLKKPRRRRRDLVRGKKRGRAKKGQDQILLDTGVLRSSMTGQAVLSTGRDKVKAKASAASAHVEVTTPTSLEWGTNLVYAGVHQYGYPPRNIPARPFLGINKEMTDDIADLVGTYIERRLAR